LKLDNQELIMMNKISMWLMLVLATSTLGSCASTTQDSVAGVKRSQLLLIPTAQVVNMSSQSYTQTLQAASKNNTLNTDQAQLDRVRSISNKLIAQVASFRADATQWQWEVNIEKSEQINAYCMPGGKIMVLTGLIDQLQATDDELAAVIGHEIAHALREHGRERMSQAYVQQFGLEALGMVLSRTSSAAVGDASMQAASLGSQLFFALPNSREQEREADKIGLELAARAAYRPDAAISLWQKMNKQTTAKPPEFLSTHPANASRIAELQALLPSVMPLYESAIAGARP
jgi:predicted Zn-dependent protease